MACTRKLFVIDANTDVIYVARCLPAHRSAAFSPRSPKRRACSCRRHWPRASLRPRSATCARRSSCLRRAACSSTRSPTRSRSSCRTGNGTPSRSPPTSWPSRAPGGASWGFASTGARRRGLPRRRVRGRAAYQQAARGALAAIRAPRSLHPANGRAQGTATWFVALLFWTIVRTNKCTHGLLAAPQTLTFELVKRLDGQLKSAVVQEAATYVRRRAALNCLRVPLLTVTHVVVLPILP